MLLADKQTDRDENITVLAELAKRQISGCRYSNIVGVAICVQGWQ